MDQGRDPIQSENWRKNYIFTGDVPIRHPDGRAKIVLDSQDLLLINPETQLVNYSLPLDEGRYEALEGLELTPREVRGFTGNDYKEKQPILENPVFNYVARNPAFFKGRFNFRNGDPDRLAAYADFVFDQRKKYRYQVTGAYLETPQSVPTMRLFRFKGLELTSQPLGQTNFFSNYYGGILIGEPAAVR